MSRFYGSLFIMLIGVPTHAVR